MLVLLGAGVLSLVLGLAVEGGDSWIEGAAIMAAVAVVVLVTAVNNFQKEAQFRELNKLNEDTQVNERCSRQHWRTTSAELLMCNGQNEALDAWCHGVLEWGVWEASTLHGLKCSCHSRAG